MTNVDLKQTLESLRSILSEPSAMDEQAVGEMRLIVDEIQSVLARSNSPNSLSQSAPVHRSLSERIQEFVEDFEVQHPQLTSNLSLIAERLADMGI